MTKTTTQRPETRPLSERDQPYGIERSYSDMRGRARDRRIEGDLALLAELQQACGRLRRGDRGATVAELALAALADCVHRVEQRFPAWELAGDDSGPLLERLDAHFKPLQAVWMRERLARDEDVQHHARESAEAETRLAEQRDAAVRASFGLPT